MSPPLRIASITTFYPPYGFGGDAVDVQRTARALARRGHHVTVIYDRDAYRCLANVEPELPPPDPLVEVIALESHVPSYSTLLTHQLGRPVIQAAALKRIERTRQFDVVLLNNVSLVGGPGILGFGGDAIRIYIAHEHWLVCPTHVLWRHNREVCDKRECVRCVLRTRRPLQMWRYTGALERAMRQVHRFVARSEFSRAKHREFGFEREMDVVPPFVPLHDQPSSGPSPHASPYFLFAGRLEPIKGVADLIRAFPRDTPANLLIAGDGSLDASLRSLASDHPRIHFLGRLSTDALATYYQHAIALVVPSIGYETFGLVITEAFSHGTAVITRNLGPLPEIVRAAGAGEVFTTLDELESMLRRFAADPEQARRLGTVGRVAVATLWSEDRVVSSLLAIIEDEQARKAGHSPTRG